MKDLSTPKAILWIGLVSLGFTALANRSAMIRRWIATDGRAGVRMRRVR